MNLIDASQVIECHEVALTTLGGGAPGIRDKGLLQASVARMSSGAGNEQFWRGPFSKAAALLESIIRNHPFVDGNKRTAFLAAMMFLRINGCVVTLNKRQAVELALDVANRRLQTYDIAEYLREHSEQVCSQ